MSKTLFRKGAHVANATAFLFASTNLVIEIGLVIWMLLGWRFVAAEIVGGAILIVVATTLLRHAPQGLVEQARSHLRSTQDDASHQGPRPLSTGELFTREGWRTVGATFYSDWAMVGTDIALGIAIAGTVAAVVPPEAWQVVFPSHEEAGLRSVLVSVLVGPLVAILAFVCSVGNIPLAAVLWENGMAFPGVVAFIFADLVTVPMVAVYRRYYGWRPALAFSACLLGTAIVSALVVHGLFEAIDLEPTRAAGGAAERDYFAWDYTTFLDLVLVPAGLLLAWSGRRAQS
jgi:hypothetical protein